MKYLILILSFILFAYFPTSIEGEMPSTNRIIFDWLMVMLLLCSYFIFLGNKINLNMIYAACIVFTLLLCSLVTLHMDNSSRLSAARFVPIFSLCLLLCIQFSVKLNLKIFLTIMDFFIPTLIIWNLLILIGDGSSPIHDFTIKHYTQLYETATRDAVALHKPIFTFSINTFASFFYCIIFYLSYQTYQSLRIFRFRVYCYLLCVINLLLFSNTSLFFSIIMLYYLLKTNKSLFFLIMHLLLICAAITYLAYDHSEMIVKYVSAFSSKHNGFLGRYFGDYASQASNLQYINSFYFIGFTIIDNTKLSYTDSGYILYYLMGGFITVLLIYIALYNFFKANLSGEDFWFLLVIFLLFEMALPVLIYYKVFFAMPFVILYLQNLKRYKDSK